MYEVRRASLWNYDLGLMVAAVGISIFGVLMIASAVQNSPGLQGSDTKQLQHLIAGLVLALILSSVDYRLIVSSGLLWYALGLAMLLVVAIIGSTMHGGQRWLPIGGFSLQPSEFMKVLMLVTLAQYLGPRREDGWRFHYLIVSGMIVGVPVALVYSQPDLSTSLVLVVMWGVAVFISGISLKQTVALIVVGLAVSPLVWLNLEPYMQDRVLDHLSPGQDPESSYIVEQALISIGSGGIWGRGYMAGPQSQLHFLRVRHTDFIFSVIAEEFGFAGVVLTLGVMGFICYRLFAIGLQASDGAGAILTCGLGALIAFQTVVNVGMNASLLPVTGLPLPFISVGGSALIAQLAGVGLAQSVAMRRRKTP